MIFSGYSSGFPHEDHVFGPNLSKRSTYGRCLCKLRSQYNLKNKNTPNTDTFSPACVTAGFKCNHDTLPTGHKLVESTLFPCELSSAMGSGVYNSTDRENRRETRIERQKHKRGRERPKK
jgi:hypothetical protein